MDEQWIESRFKDRAADRGQKRRALRTDGIPVIDASVFMGPLVSLARTVTLKVEREGNLAFGNHSIQEDIWAILMQLRDTFSLLQFLNSDDTRDINPSYRLSFSFVSLPLIRTMIDGFYNCTALLDDPSRIRQFRVSGLYRMREEMREKESIHGNDPKWTTYLQSARENLDLRMRRMGYTDKDLDYTKNQWPLLGFYVKSTPKTAHKEILARMTHGAWKEYSAISHSSFDGILKIMPVLRYETASRENRVQLLTASDRLITLHFGRAAGVLLCLLTEIQWFCKFSGADINKRLANLWNSMTQIPEVEELYSLRYKVLIDKLVYAVATS